MKMLPITLTFKKTPEEIALYKIIEKHTSKSAFIKDVLIKILVNGEFENREIN